VLCTDEYIIANSIFHVFFVPSGKELMRVRLDVQIDVDLGPVLLRKKALGNLAIELLRTCVRSLSVPKKGARIRNLLREPKIVLVSCMKKD